MPASTEACAPVGSGVSLAHTSRSSCGGKVIRIRSGIDPSEFKQCEGPSALEVLESQRFETDSCVSLRWPTNRSESRESRDTPQRFEPEVSAIPALSHHTDRLPLPIAEPCVHATIGLYNQSIFVCFARAPFCLPYVLLPYFFLPLLIRIRIHTTSHNHRLALSSGLQ